MEMWCAVEACPHRAMLKQLVAKAGEEGPASRGDMTVTTGGLSRLIPLSRYALRRGVRGAWLLCVLAVSAGEGEVGDVSSSGVSVEGTVGGSSIPQAFNIAYIRVGCPPDVKST